MYLDTSSLMYRAFFSVPNTIKDESGQPVNAVRGFLDMTSRLKSEQGPDEIVAVFDNDWRPKFRVDAYPGYKAERNDEPEDLTPQFEMLIEVLDLAGIQRAEAQGYEADDVIAAYATRVTDGGRASIVTGDRDLLCLVRDPHVQVLFTVKGVGVLKKFDEATVNENYGVAPSLYCEFAMMRGDSSDGLPGVKGVGPKTALKLLGDFGSIEGIYAHLDELTPRMQTAFTEARDYLKAMEEVVPPKTDMEIEATSQHDPDVDALRNFAAKHNLDGPVERMLETLAAGA